MRKEELIELIENLHSEDKSGSIEAIVHDVNGGTFVDIQNSLFKLFLFAIICFFIAYILLQRKK